MKTLVKKDISLVGFSNFLIIILGVILGFLSVVSYEIDPQQGILLWMGAVLTYLISSILTREDGKTKDVILKSLPIDKRDIVLSRYITMFIYITFIFGVMYISSHIYSFADGVFALGKPIPISSLLLNIIISMMFISIVLPIQYISSKMTKVVNLLLYFFLIIVPLIINRSKYNISVGEQFDYIASKIGKNNPIIFMIIGILLYLISFKISTKIYKYIDR